jgi:hypothetical protein
LRPQLITSDANKSTRPSPYSRQNGANLKKLGMKLTHYTISLLSITHEFK